MSNILMCGTDPVGQVSDMTASNISYNNTSSGLTADNVQEAIDELNENKVSKSGDTMSGNLTINRKHEGTQNVSSFLYLGNNKPEGTIGNSRGVLNLYTKGTNFVQLVAETASDQNRTIYFPDKSGTMALVEDLTADNVEYSSGVSVKAQINKKAGSVIINTLQSASFTYDTGAKYWYSNNAISYYYGSRKVLGMYVVPSYLAMVTSAFINSNGIICVAGITLPNMSPMDNNYTFSIKIAMEDYS